MKKYIAPQFAVVELENEEVIAASIDVADSEQQIDDTFIHSADRRRGVEWSNQR
jgi:hypothetical protein